MQKSDIAICTAKAVFDNVLQLKRALLALKLLVVSNNRVKLDNVIEYAYDNVENIKT